MQRDRRRGRSGRRSARAPRAGARSRPGSAAASPRSASASSTAARRSAAGGSASARVRYATALAGAPARCAARAACSSTSTTHASPRSGACSELRGDRPGAGAAVAQQPRGALVRERALVHGDVLVDGGADERVHERHRRLVGEHLGADQLAGGRDRGARRPGRRARPRAAARRRRRARRSRAPPPPRRALKRPIRTSTARDAARGAIASTSATCAASGGTPSARSALRQLDQQQRVPARRVRGRRARTRRPRRRRSAPRSRARSAASGAAITASGSRTSSPIRCACAWRSNGRTPQSTVTRSPSSRRTR